MKQIVRIKFGSHLYGTNTPNSDTDFKGVYLPSLSDCILGNAPKSISANSKVNSNEKNTELDIDDESYSLQYFLLNLGKNGDTVFLDMIHAPDNMLVNSSEEWEFIRSNRSKFYTKNLKSYLSYCKTQAAKYGIKGSKLAEAERFINYLKSHVSLSVVNNIKVADLYNEISESEYIKKYTIDTCSDADNRTIDFCGKKIMANSKVTTAIDMLDKFIKSYGDRAEAAKNNSGIDWKAISHAFRAGLQLKELYSTGDIVFPLKDAEFLRDIKLGKYHYSNDSIGQKLEDLVDEVANFADSSTYPDSVDMDFWKNWIVAIYKQV